MNNIISRNLRIGSKLQLQDSVIYHIFYSKIRSIKTSQEKTILVDQRDIKQ